MPLSAECDILRTCLFDDESIIIGDGDSSSWKVRWNRWKGMKSALDAGRKNAKAPIVVRVEDGIPISCLMEGLEIMPRSWIWPAQRRR